jgi:uncharacterized protein (DUF1800 family)
MTAAATDMQDQVDRPSARAARRRRRDGRPIGVAAAHRLLWRAGFGPRPGEVERFGAMSRRQAVLALTRPGRRQTFAGPEPRVQDGTPVFPADRDGHDHLWWLDRMVRTDQPLIERLTLIFHDWFATSNDKVDKQQHMLDQNQLIRSHVLGSFGALFHAITVDPAMLVWLDGVDNQDGDWNENYAREMMELFSLGADRGAYTEDDVRQAARALSGWTCDSNDQQGNINFRYDSGRHTPGPKTVFGHTGDYGADDVVDLCLRHPQHASFFVTKLASYFVPVPLSDRTARALQNAYIAGRYSIPAVVEGLLLSDDFWRSPQMVKPPVVYNAGLLRATRQGMSHDQWTWLGDAMGQRLFHPPNVAGWQARWLDTGTYRGRFQCAAAVLEPQVSRSAAAIRGATGAGAALDAAVRSVGSPPLTAETAKRLKAAASRVAGRGPGARVTRHTVLRQLILSSPDLQVA